MDLEGKYLNIIKAIYDQPIANIILNAEKMKAVLLNLEKEGCPLSPLLFNKVLEVLDTEIRKIKCIQIGREEIKFSLYADDMISHIENPKESTKKKPTQTDEIIQQSNRTQD